MPRPPRRIVSGCPYDAMNRGNARQPIFHKPADYDPFYRVWAERRTGVAERVAQRGKE